MAHPAYTGPTSEGVRVTGQTFLGRLQLQYGLRGLAPLRGRESEIFLDISEKRVKMTLQSRFIVPIPP